MTNKYIKDQDKFLLQEREANIEDLKPLAGGIILDKNELK